MKNEELIKLNIQLFAEEADNDTDIADSEPEDTIEEDEVDEIEEEVSETEVEELEEEEEIPAKSKKDSTKEYSERLKKERENIRKEEEVAVQTKMETFAKNRGFDSWKEMEEYDESERLQKIGVTDIDTFKKYVSDSINANPVVMEAQKIIDAQKEKDKELYVKDQISQISALDDSIKSLDDLAELDKYDEYIEKVKKGMTFVDAYKVIYFDKLASKKSEAVKIEALNNVNSKKHMKSTTGAGNVSNITVPADIFAMYKKNIPNMTDAEIRKHYAKSIGGE